MWKYDYRYDCVAVKITSKAVYKVFIIYFWDTHFTLDSIQHTAEPHASNVILVSTVQVPVLSCTIGTGTETPVATLPQGELCLQPVRR